MRLFTKDIKSMEDLMMHEPWAIIMRKNQITGALPKLVDTAANGDQKQLRFSIIKPRPPESRHP